MEPASGGSTGATRGLRRLWVLGALLLGVGIVVPGGGGIVSAPGILVLSVAAGATVARGRSVGMPLLCLGWAVPVVPAAGLAGTTAWLLAQRADLLAVYLLVNIVGTAVLASWAVFLVTAAVEVVRRRRRRFGAAGPAWKNDPTPPSYP